LARKPGKHTPYFELVDAQSMAGCPLCRLIYKATSRYLDSILYEAVLDPDVRAKLKRANGFCSEHVEMLRSKPGRALGIALIYRDIIRSISEAAQQEHRAATTQGIARLWRRHGQPAGASRLLSDEPCPACAIKDRTENDFTELLITHIDDDKLYEAYSHGEGLCLPHLIKALQGTEDEHTVSRLVEPQIARYQGMLADLDEFIRKRDHRFRMEKYGEEGDVWLRVMNAITGGSGMGLSAKWGGRRSDDYDMASR